MEINYHPKHFPSAVLMVNLFAANRFIGYIIIAFITAMIAGLIMTIAVALTMVGYPLTVAWDSLKHTRKKAAGPPILNFQINEQQDRPRQRLPKTEQDRENSGLLMRNAVIDELPRENINAINLNPEPIDLYEVLCYCVRQLHHKADAKGQHINLQGVAVILPVDLEQLWRVICHLIANAIKFSPRGAIIHVVLQEIPGRVCIMVMDQGMGIPAALKDSVFDPFNEAKRNGTAGEQPFGIGLALSKQIVEAQGGSLHFESEPGNGTTFFLNLPSG